jgi:hypothetical protein
VDEQSAAPQRGIGLSRDGAVAVIFAAMIVGLVGFAAAHAWFWQKAHDTAPVAALLLLLLVTALLRRHRAAWWILVAIAVGAVLSSITDMVGGMTAGRAAGLVFSAIELGLLVSAPMRRHVGFGRA